MTRSDKAGLQKLKETVVLHKLQAAKLLADKDPLNLNKTDAIDTPNEIKEYMKNKPKPS